MITKFDGTREQLKALLVRMRCAAPDSEWEQIERYCWRLKLPGRHEIRYRCKKYVSVTVAGSQAKELREILNPTFKEYGSKILLFLEPKDELDHNGRRKAPEKINKKDLNKPRPFCD